MLQSLQGDLNKDNIKIGRDRFFAFLKTHRLQIKRRKLKPLVTNSLHHYYKHPNLIKGLTVKHWNGVEQKDLTDSGKPLYKYN